MVSQTEVAAGRTTCYLPALKLHQIGKQLRAAAHDTFPPICNIGIVRASSARFELPTPPNDEGSHPIPSFFALSLPHRYARVKHSTRNFVSSTRIFSFTAQTSSILRAQKRVDL
ncbi:hypothetical protein Cob_v005997 [Colletotrichum orbiculare MAFF 240422]|uniref:Uncharacterized protein n=1 Tax=Colletotrichum orbiculare (strain 104-T / ATCC 96160 / CBS 514.97 / LARS 414 / MAFF 240422) TaxID=1213857 RepID=A0A484FTL8_COLOR|nr:hypothetical protein Cob_v005997 [Colletotrichum orbiculare MAFF 240422]